MIERDGLASDPGVAKLSLDQCPPGATHRLPARRIAGAIYDPMSRDWAYAVRGGGAWIEQEDGSRADDSG